ncbi:putative inositol 5-phosphatase [Schistosoma mansoni]|uniref:putative inositol 5-phosphatase n=1 Tax=Schistosoma mansoni TaxID=6183 RepID=UPI0001A64231|nr:putative inositol 5-phosphatase [Schistosoma mansoni]|eukprot:XP_018655319.1 putative inositol 5-phosphatase [Schistosoma mansoni]
MKEKLHSLGKLYGCIDCQTYYLDEKMANYHLSSMHGNLKNQSSSSSLLDSVDNSSKKFECFLCGVNLNNSLLFLEHFTHCLSLKKHNGIDLMMKQTTTDSLTILSDNKTTDNNKNTCNELDENEDENINEQSVNEPTQITNTTSQELHTVSSIIDNCNDNNNNNNDNNDPVLLNSINDQSEIKLNGYCIEETIELHEKDDDLHISSPCSIIVSNSVDQLNGKSIDNL